MKSGYAPEGQSQAERFLAQAETVAYLYLRGMVLARRRRAWGIAIS